MNELVSLGRLGLRIEENTVLKTNTVKIHGSNLKSTGKLMAEITLLVFLLRNDELRSPPLNKRLSHAYSRAISTRHEG